MSSFRNPIQFWKDDAIAYFLSDPPLYLEKALNPFEPDPKQSMFRLIGTLRTASQITFKNIILSYILI